MGSPRGVEAVQVHGVGALLEQETVASLAGGEVLARQPGLLHRLLQLPLLAAEAVHREADQHADDEVADHGDDVVPQVTLMDVGEGYRRDQRRPQGDDDTSAQSQEVGAGHHERRSDDLHDIHRQEKSRQCVGEGEGEYDCTEATSAQTRPPGAGWCQYSAPSGPS